MMNKLEKAIKDYWKIENGFDEKIVIDELDDDWILWSREGDDKVGGKRLVVPKHGNQTFDIPSNYYADDKHGVTSEYKVTILEVPKNIDKEALSLLEKHIGINQITIYKFLKSDFPDLKYFFILKPLELLRELKRYKIYIKLFRKDNQGGYL